MSAFAIYWRAYGGLKALLFSPYLLGAAAFWVWCKPIWDGHDASGFVWFEWGMSLIASILAFSLGSLAIFLAFSNEKFLVVVRNKGEPSSYFMTAVSAIFHFILAQFFALGLIILLVAYQNVVVSGVAFFLFCYAMACGIAAAAALVDTAFILNKMGMFDDDFDE